MPEPNPVRAKLSPDDYCRVFGRIIFDAFYRIESLEKQFSSMYEAFQAQAEDLRAQLQEERTNRESPAKTN